MKPCVLISSCHIESLPPETVVRGILELDPEDELNPLEEPEVQEVDVYPWSFATKYYKADINVCTMKSKNIGTKDFAESVNAVILCFNAELESGLTSVEQWLPFINEFEAEVKLLVCERCPDEENDLSNVKFAGETKKVEAQKWCVKNGFELVELNPPLSLDDDVEDDFPECLGIKRIIQALHSHLWPNLKLHQAKTPTSDQGENCLTGQSQTPEQNSCSIDTSSITNGIDSMLESAIGGSDESFDQLFEKLSEMKLKTESMSTDERRAFAEKMAISFWKSLGGNESEIEGLSSDEDT